MICFPGGVVRESSKPTFGHRCLEHADEVVIGGINMLLGGCTAFKSFHSCQQPLYAQVDGSTHLQFTSTLLCRHLVGLIEMSFKIKPFRRKGSHEHCPVNDGVNVQMLSVVINMMPDRRKWIGDNV